MMIPFTDLKPQYDAIRTSFGREVEGMFSETGFILSPQVESFEDRFAAFCGADYCVGVNSGTDALLLLLKAYGIGPGDEVILPTNTFIATAEAVYHSGATPIFCDVLDTTKCISPLQVEQHITARTKAVIAVHLYGNPAPMEAIQTLLNHRPIVLLEDACQAHGAELNGISVGALGDAAAFSFYPGKNLGAFGDGGAIVTSDSQIAKKTRMLRNHGSIKKYRHECIGYTSRLDSIQAIALRLKLKRLPEWNALRQKRALLYRALLSGLGWLKMPQVTPGATSANHLFTAEIVHPRLERDDMIVHLRRHGIECGIHYPTPLHLSEAFRYLGYRSGAFPIAERTMRNHLSLPMYAELTDSMVEFVAEKVSAFSRTRKSLRGPAAALNHATKKLEPLR